MISRYNRYQGFALCANSLTSMVTRQPCMQDTPYLTLPFSLLSEIFSVFGFAKYAPMMFGKTVRAKKLVTTRLAFSPLQIKIFDPQNSRARCARTSCFGIAAELPAGSTFDKSYFKTF